MTEPVLRPAYRITMTNSPGTLYMAGGDEAGVPVAILLSATDRGELQYRVSDVQGPFGSWTVTEILDEQGEPAIGQVTIR